MKKYKRVLFVCDQHCGHKVGLTPPGFQSELCGKQYHRIQVELYDWYRDMVTELKPIDILAINGDCIDGQGSRSGGSELIAPDLNKQIEMAIRTIEIVEAKTHIMTYGTAYHTGQAQDQEKIIANHFNADISSHQWFDVNGTMFDMKHKVGNSSVPHGKGTPLAKEWLWNTLWAEQYEQPRADVYIRSHVHNFSFCGGADWIAMSLPALQGQGSKYGARECSQEVHFGLVWFDCYNDGSYKWSKRILRAKAQKQIAKTL